MVKLNIISEKSSRPIWATGETPLAKHFFSPKQINLETSQVDQYSPPNKLSFIETGTYRGDTFVRMLKHGFKFGRTVELNDDIISEDNQETVRQMMRDDPTLDFGIYRGDSPDLIPLFLKDLKEKFPDVKDQEATFWLDAHASGELQGGRSGGCPLLDELAAIEKDSIKTHTIFINDRRLFGSAEWSFVKESEVLDALKRINPKYTILNIEGQLMPEDIIVATVYAPPSV